MWGKTVISYSTYCDMFNSYSTYMVVPKHIYLNLYDAAKTYPTYNFLAKSYTNRHISCHIIYFCLCGCMSANFIDEDAMCIIFFLKLNSHLLKINF